MEWVMNPGWWALVIALGSLGLGVRNALHDRADRINGEVTWRALPPALIGDRLQLSIRNTGTHTAWSPAVDTRAFGGVGYSGTFADVKTDPGERLTATVAKQDQAHLPESVQLTWIRTLGWGKNPTVQIDTSAWRETPSRS